MPIKMRCRRLNMHLYCKLLCRVLTLYVINKSKLHKLTHTLQKYFTTSQTPPPKKKSHHYYNYQKFMTTMTTATKF